MIQAALPAGDRLILAVTRPGSRPRDSRAPTEVLRLDPGADPHVLLPLDSLEVSAHCWPLVDQRALLGGYPAEMLDDSGVLRDVWRLDNGTGKSFIDGISDVETSLQGEWPDTEIQWLFHYDRMHGVRLRRRNRLYGDFGRPNVPVVAEISSWKTSDPDSYRQPRTPATASSTSNEEHNVDPRLPNHHRLVSSQR